MRDGPDPRLATVDDCVMAAAHCLFQVYNRVKVLPLFRERILVLPNPIHDDVDEGGHEAV
jgi:hypothetical protein